MSSVSSHYDHSIQHVYPLLSQQRAWHILAGKDQRWLRSISISTAQVLYLAGLHLDAHGTKPSLALGAKVGNVGAFSTTTRNKASALKKYNHNFTNTDFSRMTFVA